LGKNSTLLFSFVPKDLMPKNPLTRGSFRAGLLIRCEGSIPKSPLARGNLGAEPRVWTLSQIPYENNHTPLLAAGYG
jgi:hypothetical protein